MAAMTVLFPCSRTLSTQLPTRSAVLTRLLSTTPRVVRLPLTRASSRGRLDGADLATVFVRARRGYASDAKPATRAKATTGTKAKRTTKSKPAKSKTATSKKPKKVKKAKAKSKPKAKPKKKAPTKQALKQQAREQQDVTNKIALLRQEPATKPASAWQLCISRNSARGTNVTAQTQGISSIYKALSPEEREVFACVLKDAFCANLWQSLNHEANQNKLQNQAAYKAWVESYTPLQIHHANLARVKLLRTHKEAGQKSLVQYRPIKDERSVKGHRTAFAFFVKERLDSGDFKGMNVGEAFRLMSREFKELPSSESKVCREL